MSKMDKVTRMSAPSLLWLLREMVKAENGITTKRLWDCTLEWDDKAFAREFDEALKLLLAEGYRCTNKQVYKIGAEPVEKRTRSVKDDSRQLRMFG